MLMSGGRLGQGKFDLLPLSGPRAGPPLLASCSFIAHPITITMAGVGVEDRPKYVFEVL